MIVAAMNVAGFEMIVAMNVAGFEMDVWKTERRHV